MILLKDRIALLESDLLATPPRISTYSDLPFAILRYDPWEEWKARHEIRLLSARLRNAGREVVIISMASLLWEAIERCEGLEAIVQLEVERGFDAAQEQVNVYLSDPDWSPLADMLADKLKTLDRERTVAFLVRAGAMAPAIYQMSRLLDEMKGRTEVPAVLFYPGTLEGSRGLRFVNLPERETQGNYRVKIYG